MQSDISNSLNALRTTYMNIFSQIFENNININCICKTNSSPIFSFNNQSAKTQNRNDLAINTNIHLDSDDENDVEMKDVSENDQTNENNKVTSNKSNKLNKTCDLSCFEDLKLVVISLKKCFNNENTEATNDEIEKFETTWSSLKFLVKKPDSCDYNGTTIFHCAATDNCYSLLKSIVKKYPNGVSLIDSKGMTPLMRAVQRNSIKCVEYLLNDTESDISGSKYSAYTPLWFSVSNGYNEIVRLLLNYGAHPSIVYKNRVYSNTSNNLSNESVDTIVNYNEGRVGVRGHHQNTNESSTNCNLYLFSPLRASIVYQRFDIMIYLLEYGANVNELFDGNVWNQSYEKKSQNKPNDDYVNSLKFFYREFGKYIILKNTEDEYEKYFFKLNSFIKNQNVYRRMLIEFVKDICFKINSNLNLQDAINKSFNNKLFSLQFITNLTEQIESNQKNIYDYSDWNDYIDLVKEFMLSIDSFLISQQATNVEQQQQILPVHVYKILEYKKPNYHDQVFEFSKYLCRKFLSAKSLKELCRFKVRNMLFDSMDTRKLKYTNDFTKKDHQLFIMSKLDLPANLNNYILHID